LLKEFAERKVAAFTYLTHHIYSKFSIYCYSEDWKLLRNRSQEPMLIWQIPSSCQDFQSIWIGYGQHDSKGFMEESRIRVLQTGWHIPVTR
jgi:endo-1,4-beta-D-glucanase Y